MGKILSLLLPVITHIKNPIIRNALIVVTVIGTGVLLWLHPTLLSM